MSLVTVISPLVESFGSRLSLKTQKNKNKNNNKIYIYFFEIWRGKRENPMLLLLLLDMVSGEE